MPTNNVKHDMLRLAKKIVAIQVNQEVEREKYIIKTLKEHPEFDANTFRGMIKEIQVRNKQNEVKE